MTFFQTVIITKLNTIKLMCLSLLKPVFDLSIKSRMISFKGDNVVSFFGLNTLKPSTIHEDAIDMPHRIDDQETWMGRY